jgi:hypothetical protein
MRAFGFVAVILALGTAFYLFNRSAASGPGAKPPQAQVDVVAIRQRLLTIAQTERQFRATHGSYGTLDQLAQEDLLPGGTEERGYTFSADVSGSERFAITATPTDPAKSAWPTLQVTERMEVTERQ